jgi:hypothetical protein
MKTEVPKIRIVVIRLPAFNAGRNASMTTSFSTSLGYMAA